MADNLFVGQRPHPAKQGPCRAVPDHAQVMLDQQTGHELVVTRRGGVLDRFEREAV
jgi:hypothetical protein